MTTSFFSLQIILILVVVVVVMIISQRKRKVEFILHQQALVDIHATKKGEKHFGIEIARGGEKELQR